MSKNEHGLTPQREKFAQLLASGTMNQSDAYRGSFQAKKMTPKQIHEEASKVAADPKVRQRVRQIQEIGAAKAGLVVADILEELRRIAMSDISGIICKQTGKVLLPHELDPATRAAVASFKIDEYGRIEYKFWDKNSAITNAMKHKGLFEADNQQKPPMVGTVRLVPLTKAKESTKE